MAHLLPTNLLQAGECSGLLHCYAKWANDVTAGFFWIGMLLGFYVALYMATARLGNTRAFGFSSTIGLIGSLFLVTLGFISWWIASAFILVGCIGIAAMILSER